MMRATLSFNLPDESDEFDAAIQGHEALTLLWSIRRHCRSVLDDCEPDASEERLAEEICAMIADSDITIE